MQSLLLRSLARFFGTVCERIIWIAAVFCEIPRNDETQKPQLSGLFSLGEMCDNKITNWHEFSITNIHEFTRINNRDFFHELHEYGFVIFVGYLCILAVHQTQAIILKKDFSGEADLLITAFSEKYGKIRLLAQGARKESAKLKGHLEPGTYALLGFVAGKNIYRLTETDTIESFPDTSQSFKKIKARAWIFDFVERHTMEDLRGEAGDFFAALVNFLRDLENARESTLFIRALILRTEFSLYRYLGILPDSAPRLHETYNEGVLAQAETFSRVISEQELHSQRSIVI